MKFVKILVTVIFFITALIGLFSLLLYSRQYQPDKIVDINPRYVNKPPYLLPAKPYYTIYSWNIGAAVSGMGTDVFYEGGHLTRPASDSVTALFSGIKGYLGTLINSNADFILLQEVDLSSRRSYKTNQFREINAIFPEYACCAALNHNVLFVPLPLWRPYGKVMAGMETISVSYPLETVRYDFGKQGKFPYRLFTQDNCCIINNYRLRSGKTLVVINVQNGIFAVKEQNTDLIRALMALMVTEYEKGNYVIAGGDWSSNPDGYNGSFITGDLSCETGIKFPPGFIPDGWTIAFDERIPTSRSMEAVYQKGVTPTTITDFFIVSPNVQTIETKTINFGFKYASHNPVTMKFSLK